jgi:hypothetical protein
MVALAIGLVAAAVAGAVLVAIDVFPQPFLTVLILGVAFGAAGIAVHFLRDPLTPTPAAAPVSTPPIQHRPSPAESERDLQMRQKEEGSRRRRAARRIREELLDAKHLLQRMPEGGSRDIDDIRFTVWDQEKDALLEHDVPGPYTAASDAYRELTALLRTQYRKVDGLWERNAETELLETDVLSAIQAIDRALVALETLERDQP